MWEGEKKVCVCVCLYSVLINIKDNLELCGWLSEWGLQNTPTASLQRSKTPMSALIMTLNNLMVRLGECGVPLIAIAPKSTLAWSGGT